MQKASSTFTDKENTSKSKTILQFWNIGFVIDIYIFVPFYHYSILCVNYKMENLI